MSNAEGSDILRDYNGQGRVTPEVHNQDLSCEECGEKHFRSGDLCGECSD
jgi:hypothetical protein